MKLWGIYYRSLILVSITFFIPGLTTGYQSRSPIPLTSTKEPNRQIWGYHGNLKRRFTRWTWSGDGGKAAR